MIGGSCDSASASSCCVSVCVCAFAREDRGGVLVQRRGPEMSDTFNILSVTTLTPPFLTSALPPASLTHPHVQMHRLHAGDELWAFCGDDVMLDYRERNQNDKRAVFCRGFTLVI